MKLLVTLLALAGLVGCANTPNRSAAMSYEQLGQIVTTSRQCPQIQQITDLVDEQLKLRGLMGVNPEDMNYDDMLYNRRAHIIIWSLRVGCNNPDRYKS